MGTQGAEGKGAEGQPVAIVTGVSSGIGQVTASALVRGGYRVFGSVRQASTPVPEGVERIVLDVRDNGSVVAGVREVLDRAGRIDLLVNNAGSGLVAPVEETETSQAQDLFDTNFFGAVRVTRAVLPTMRAQRSGRLIFVGSVVGVIPAPYMAFYAASKHAIEGYCESLDHEVRSFGIRVSIIEPGFMKTLIDQKAPPAGVGISDYARARGRAQQALSKAIQSGEDPAIVAGVILEAARSPRPRLRYPVGKGIATVTTLRGLLPAGMFDRSLRRQFHLDD